MTEAIVQHQEPAELARYQYEEGISVEALLDRVKKIRQIRDDVMEEGVHYGKIPGVKKESLLKPGAEVLCMAFGLAPKFRWEERIDGEHREYIVTCTLVSASGRELGEGAGSCSTRESKYAYRKGSRKCPACGSETSLKKSKQNPEWYCWAKIGGCGETFDLDDERITKQEVGRVPNPDIADQYNTVLKMACKRAHVAATLFVTGASELFTQDLEDMDNGQVDDSDDAAERPANGNGRGRKSQGEQQRKPQPVASESDVHLLLRRISSATSVPELEEIRQSCRGMRFAAAASKTLSEAVKARREQLEDPDFLDAQDREAGL